MSKKKQKDFDAVKMMREIRDDLSRKLMTMSHEEQQRYIKEQLGVEPRSTGTGAPSPFHRITFEFSGASRAITQLASAATRVWRRIAKGQRR